MTLYNAFSIGNGFSGEQLKITKAECIAATKRQGGAAAVQCVLTRLTTFEAALMASRQYILTLWPAFVGAVCALGPDPAVMVHDNVWWATLFAMSCSGLPGLNTIKPPHHIEATTTGQGRITCEHWRPDKLSPRNVSRSWVLAGTPPRQTLVVLEWIVFLGCLALYLTFSVLFANALQTSFLLTFYGSTVPAAVWYWISAGPAILAIILSEVWQNRVELYELDDNVDGIQLHDSGSKSPGAVSSALLPTASASTAVGLPVTPDRASLLAVPYHRVNTRTALQVWMKIIAHQWHRRYYRLLIKPSSTHPYFLLVRLIVGIWRITVFALGSVTMGNILLMPIPQDLVLFVLLLFTTAIPRMVFPAFWSNGTRGADLVVFVSLVGIVDS